ncbi:MAG: hypothetical protein ACHQ2Z_00255 [Elusimicrobiota bacterium]
MGRTSRKLWRSVWLARVAVAAAAFSACLIVAEIALRLYGASLAAGAPAASSGRLRILCLGESTTAAIPPIDFSWPAQLQDILDDSFGKGAVSVINEGVIATNTDVSLARLPALLARERPHVVVAMMGVNDDQWYGVAPERGRLLAALSALRVVRAGRWLYHELPKTIEGPTSLEAIVRDFEAAGDQDPRWIAAKTEASALFRKGRVAQARKVLEPFLQAPDASRRSQEVEESFFRSGDAKAYEQGDLLAAAAVPPAPAYLGRWLRLIYQMRYPESEALARGVLRGARRDPLAHLLLGQSLDKLDRFAEARSELEEALACAPKDWPLRPRAVFFLSITDWLAQRVKEFALRGPITQQPIAPEAGRNYLRLREILRRRGIRLIAMQYPLRDPAPLRAIFEPEGGVAVIDNRGTFRRALARHARHEIFTDSFAGDFGHCTARGYRLIAQNVVAELRSEGLLGRR